ncbi:MAG TPA: hypothetical protein VHY37_02695 [Tepidisphaeraceae bacterium]|jgi:hypothetical protein|nr:hypothetical protein [Tepidisphaeraceae bacterium]
MSSSAITASLVVAALELKEVQLVRGAIRQADEEAGPQHRFLDSDSYCPSGPCKACSPCYESPEVLPARVYHPTPRYEPRPVLHPTVRLEMERTVEPPPAPVEPPMRGEPGPIQPPWRSSPWPLQPVRLVKVIVQRPEMMNTGGVIDCFI